MAHEAFKAVVANATVCPQCKGQGGSGSKCPTCDGAGFLKGKPAIETNTALESSFRIFDTDGSGTLTATELKQLLMREGDLALSEADAQEIIREADRNGDGVLDIREFVEMMEGRRARQ